MTAGCTSGVFNRDWFTFQGGYGILKRECVSRFREAVQAKEQEQRLELLQRPGPDACLLFARAQLYRHRRGPKPYDISLLSSGGNVLDWSKYLSTFEYLNPDTGSWEKTRSAILFGRLQNVLTKMGA